MRMTKKHLKEAIKSAVAKDEYISLYDETIFYYMMGYAPEASIKVIGNIILELRHEELERG